MFALTRVAPLALAYFVTGWLGLQMPYAGSHITLVWLPTGIAVAALLRQRVAVERGGHRVRLARDVEQHRRDRAHDRVQRDACQQQRRVYTLLVRSNPSSRKIYQ